MDYIIIILLLFIIEYLIIKSAVKNAIKEIIENNDLKKTNQNDSPPD